MWCDFGANLVQHFMLAYSRYSRYQTVLLKLKEIISILSKSKNAPIFRSIFYYLFENVEINPLRDSRYVANATRYSCRSICLLRKRGIYLISSLSRAKTYRICRKANISSRAMRGISTKNQHNLP